MAGTNGAPAFQAGESYPCICEDVMDTESNNKGTPGLAFKMRVFEGEMEGEKIEVTRWVTPGTMESIERDLGILGFDVHANKWDALRPTVTGQKCIVTMKADDYRGKARVIPDRIKPLSAASTEPGGVLGKIARMFGGTVSGSAGAAATAARGDVPFLKSPVEDCFGEGERRLRHLRIIG